MRAALAVTLYAQGLTAEAETNWGRVEVLPFVPSVLFLFEIKLLYSAEKFFVYRMNVLIHSMCD